MVRDWLRDVDERRLGTGGKSVIDEAHMIVRHNKDINRSSMFKPKVDSEGNKEARSSNGTVINGASSVEKYS